MLVYPSYDPEYFHSAFLKSEKRKKCLSESRVVNIFQSVTFDESASRPTFCHGIVESEYWASSLLQLKTLQNDHLSTIQEEL